MFLRKLNVFIVLLIFPSMLTIQSCEEIPNEIIDKENLEFAVTSISAPEIVIYSQNNTATTTITINNAETVNSVWFDITTINGIDQISRNNEMLATSSSASKVYIGEYEFDQDLLPGNYEFSYYVEDAVNVDGENIRKVGTKQFRFILEEENVPPVISNPTVPEATPRGSRVVISVRVIDSNGPDDVDEVYFRLTDADNDPVFYDEANSVLEFPLLDDGEDGDLRRNDGIYSAYYIFSDSAKLGEWKFEIEAKDSEGALSNLIERNSLITLNSPPEISDLTIPEEIDRGVEFIFSIFVTDPNGLSDINLVYFELRRPDGTIVYLDEDNTITTFPMFDNGDFEGAGDETEGDGIYSLKNSFGQEAQTGDWTFTFNAQDNSGVFSNTITHILKVN